MRLLDTSTIKLHKFENSFIPYYAILSHRWGTEELSFQDLQEQDERCVEKNGFSKIVRCCAHAASEGWQYVWIDTCCIDKSSSSELSEAINSMYRWYEDAQICYVYLSDVQEGDNPCGSRSAFRRSEWFTRGWTLQELLAPAVVVFLNRDWIQIGTKSSLRETIMSITGIGLLDNFRSACVAQKMSWASRRQTTRVEDLAYCLMGLFGVNMAPLYGEGENAFKRLQLEILDQEDDESIFAWKDFFAGGGLLAHSPASFRHSGDVERSSSATERERPPFSMTNKGLRIELHLTPLERLPQDLLASQNGASNAFLAPLNCNRQNSDDCLALLLVKDSNQIFRRIYNELIACERLEVEKKGQTQLVYVPQMTPNMPPVWERGGLRSFRVLLDSRAMHKNGFLMMSDNKLLPGYGWIYKLLWAEGNFTVRDLPSLLGAIVYENKNSDSFALLFGADGHGRVGVEIAICPECQSWNEFLYDIQWDQLRSDRTSPLAPICKQIRQGLWISVGLGKRMVGRECTFVANVTPRQTKAVS